MFKLGAHACRACCEAIPAWTIFHTGCSMGLQAYEFVFLNNSSGLFGDSGVTRPSPNNNDGIFSDGLYNEAQITGTFPYLTSSHYTFFYENTSGDYFNYKNLPFNDNGVTATMRLQRTHARTCIGPWLEIAKIDRIHLEQSGRVLEWNFSPTALGRYVGDQTFTNHIYNVYTLDGLPNPSGDVRVGTGCVQYYNPFLFPGSSCEVFKYTNLKGMLTQSRNDFAMTVSGERIGQTNDIVSLHHFMTLRAHNSLYPVMDGYRTTQGSTITGAQATYPTGTPYDFYENHPVIHIEAESEFTSISSSFIQGCHGFLDQKTITHNGSCTAYQSGMLGFYQNAVSTISGYYFISQQPLYCKTPYVSFGSVSVPSSPTSHTHSASYPCNGYTYPYDPFGGEPPPCTITCTTTLDVYDIRGYPGVTLTMPIINYENINPVCYPAPISPTYPNACSGSSNFIFGADGYCGQPTSGVQWCGPNGVCGVGQGEPSGCGGFGGWFCPNHTSFLNPDPYFAIMNNNIQVFAQDNVTVSCPGQENCIPPFGDEDEWVHNAFYYIGGANEEFGTYGDPDYYAIMGLTSFKTLRASEIMDRHMLCPLDMTFNYSHVSTAPAQQPGTTPEYTVTNTINTTFHLFEQNTALSNNYCPEA